MVVSNKKTSFLLDKNYDSLNQALNQIQDLLSRFNLENQIMKKSFLGKDQKKQLLLQQITHQNQITTLRNKLSNFRSVELAYILQNFPLRDREFIWKNIKTLYRSEILIEVNEPVRASLINWCNFDELLHIAQNLEPDDLAEIANKIPNEIIEKVSEGLSIQEKEQFRVAMSYPIDSVGSHMDFEMITIRDNIKLEVVHRYLRRIDKFPPHTNKLFVVDRNNLLKGSLSLENLLIKEPEVSVIDVMQKEIIFFNVKDKIDDVSLAFERYDLISAPVIDNNGRLIGRVIASEIVDVIREENDSEVLASVGLQHQEDIFASVFSAVKNRWIWLATNLLTAFLASRMIGIFEDTIQQVVALAALTPIIVGIAGNSGNQTLTLIVRSLALGKVSTSYIRKLFVKEIAVAVLNGIVWGAIAGIITWAIYFNNPKGLLLGLLMMISIVLNLIFAGIVGVFVPFFLNSLKKDPAIGASVLLTFGTDSMGFLIFLGLATLIF